MKPGTLILFCGKMGAGKTTQAKKIADERNAIILAEDEWLESIYPNQITSLTDYKKYSRLLKPQIKELVQSILLKGIDVVMDFPANTRSQRAWLKTICSEVNASHILIYINVSNERCLKHIEQRRTEQPERSSTDTVEMFEQMALYFVEPTIEEEFNVVQISNTG